MRFLTKKDKENYLAWHKTRYEKDIKLAEELQEKDENWTIIIGYYAMHNITKYFLATKNIFLREKTHIHEKCIEELEKLCTTNLQNLKDTLYLLKKAKEQYDKFFDPKQLPIVLRVAKNERSKANYYSERELNEAKTYLEEYVKPYLETIRGLIEND